MSQDQVEKFLGRMLTDDGFRERAAGALAATCREEGYLLSDEEMNAITAEDLARLALVSSRLDRSIKRFCHAGCEAAGKNGNAETGGYDNTGDHGNSEESGSKEVAS